MAKSQTLLAGESAKSQLSEQQHNLESLMKKFASNGTEGDRSLCKSEISIEKSGGDDCINKIKAVQYSNLYSVDETDQHNRKSSKD